MKFISNMLIVALIFISVCGKSFLTHNTWPNNLATILKHDATANQFLLLYVNDFNNSGIYQIGNRISRILPTQVADFMSTSKASNRRLLTSASDRLLQKTIVIIIASRNDSENLSKVYSVITSVAELSAPFTRPQVLLIVTTTVKSGNYQKFFQKTWSKQFLDVTILEIIEKSAGNGIREFATMHQYNPFKNSLMKEKFSKSSILFPDKLQDLNGYRMKAGIFHYPPYIYVERNSTGSVLSVRGSDYHWMFAMAKYLNFSLELVISNASNWDLISCNKTENVGITNQTIHNEIQFIGIQVAIYDTCVNNFVSISRGTKMFRFVVLAPILPMEREISTNEWRFLNLISIFSLFLIPVFIAKYYNFEHRNWKVMYALQMVLGYPIPRMPEKTKERLIISLLLIFYVLESSQIFTTLSEMQLQKKSFRKLETFKDLLDANLTLVTNTNITEGGGLDENDTYEKLLKTVIVSDDTLGNWMIFLAVYQNISYLCRENLAFLNLLNSNYPDRQQKVRIIEEISGVWPGGLYLEEGSPYKNRFDRVMSTFMESGLSNKWDAAYITKSIPKQNLSFLYHQESSLMSKVRTLMIVILFFGYFSSLLAFTVEFFIHKFHKN